MDLPNFHLSANDGQDYSHEFLADKKVIFFIYPKDNTPGCTLEANDFSRLFSEFKTLGFLVLGVSKDSLKSHDSFCQKHNLTMPLISDPDGALIEGLGAWKEKSMYGKTFMGIERSTFVFVDGVLKKEWRKVRTKGHADEVLGWTKETFC